MLTFDEPTHTYTLDGTKIDYSITTVLRAFGLPDFSHVPPLTLERARLRGTIVHQALHARNERDLDDEAFERDHPDCVPYVRAWDAFCAQRKFVAVLNEHRVASRRYGVAGTVDTFGTLDGQGVLLDFSTGDHSHKDLQTAAYLLLAHEWASEDPALGLFFAHHGVVRRYAVRLRSNATFALEGFSDPADTRNFLTLLAAQRIVAARRPRAVAEVA